MRKNFFKHLFILLGFPTLCLGSSYESSHPCLPPCPCEVNPCCPRTPAYGFDVPCDVATLFSAGPKACRNAESNNFMEVAFIWWTAREDGLAFATSGVNGTNTLPQQGSGIVFHPDWQWKPGFKVALGRNLRFDDWDISAAYTWIKFNGDTETAEDPDPLTNINELSPIWQDQDTVVLSLIGDTLRNASSKWKFWLNVIDLEVGKNYFVSQMLAIRPFFGLKLTAQEMKYQVQYQFSSIVQPHNLDIFTMRQKQEIWGVGIRFGYHANYFLSRNFSLFGHLALTGLLSRFNIDRRDFLQEFDEEFILPTFHATNKFNSIKGILELFLGMQFDLWIGNSHRYHFQFNGGWEEQLWWNHNQLISLLETSSHGDLMLHGLTVQARLDF